MAELRVQVSTRLCASRNCTARERRKVQLSLRQDALRKAEAVFRQLHKPTETPTSAVMVRCKGGDAMSLAPASKRTKVEWQIQQHPSEVPVHVVKIDHRPEQPPAPTVEIVSAPAVVPTVVHRVVADASRREQRCQSTPEPPTFRPEATREEKRKRPFRREKAAYVTKWKEEWRNKHRR